MRCTYLRLIVLFVCLLLTNVSRGEKSLTAEQVALRLQKVYENTYDFKAAFLQEYESVAWGQKKVSSGFVYVKKGGKMRWDYKKPYPKHFVTNSKAMYVYDPTLAQVIVDQNFSTSELSMALTFLWGKGRLQDEFYITFAKEKKFLMPKHYVLELTPKKKAQFKRLWFVVKHTDFYVLKTIIEDPGGNINCISFSKLAINVGLSDKAFEFEIPSGIEVIKATKTLPN